MEVGMELLIVFWLLIAIAAWASWMLVRRERRAPLRRRLEGL
jgi:predicted permease